MPQTKHRSLCTLLDLSRRAVHPPSEYQYTMATRQAGNLYVWGELTRHKQHSPELAFRPPSTGTSQTESGRRRQTTALSTLGCRPLLGGATHLFSQCPRVRGPREMTTSCILEFSHRFCGYSLSRNSITCEQASIWASLCPSMNLPTNWRPASGTATLARTSLSKCPGRTRPPRS